MRCSWVLISAAVYFEQRIQNHPPKYKRKVFRTLQEFLVSHKNIEIARLSETHLSEENLIDLCELDGYTFLNRNQAHGKGGGIAIYIKNNIAFQHRHDIEGSLECL